MDCLSKLLSIKLFYQRTWISFEIPARIFIASLVSLLGGVRRVLFLCSYKWRSGSFRSSKIISGFRLIRHRIPSKCATIRRDMAQKGGAHYRRPFPWHMNLKLQPGYSGMGTQAHSKMSITEQWIVFSLLSLFWKNRVELRDHVAVCVCVCIPLSLLGNGSVRISLSLLGNGSVKIPLSLLGNGSVRIPLSLLGNCSVRIPLSLLGNGS
jgi:hypothetical protein